jgi:hypothetical protein
MPTTPTVSPTAPAASHTRRTAADVKADRRSPEGPGLDTGEDRRTLTKAGTTLTSDPDHVHNAALRTTTHARSRDQRALRIDCVGSPSASHYGTILV